MHNAGTQEPPELVRLPLRARLDAFARGGVDPADWAEQANAWSFVADERYRATTLLCPVEPADPPVRLGVKDTVDVARLPTRLGLRRHRGYPERSAAALDGVTGAVVNAKLVTTELSLGLEHGCVNPYFPHLDPAGSSTGCAVAVAAGISDLAMGTDSVASVRLPAAACGVVGLRLTHDPRLLDGLYRLSDRLDAPGWLTRTVDDLDVLCRSGALGARLAADGRRPDGAWRIGVPEEVLADRMLPEVRADYDRVRAAVEAAGAELVPVRLGELFRRRALAYELCAKDAFDAYVRWRAGGYGEADEPAPSTRRALEMGAAVGPDRHAELIAVHERHRALARRLFAEDRVDGWLMPAGTLLPRNLHTEAAPETTIRTADPETTAGPGDEGDDDGYDGVNYATMAAFAGLPALNFPLAYDAGHEAPLGMQLIGPPDTEPALIALASFVTGAAGTATHYLGRPSKWPAGEGR
ncbi:amidase family protein [Streptomyces sp. NPDC058084]|uniref:amidase family protein n=1 Tax=Streptomyces sp. NPDC058084 TaxID=3346333 RepID=UPI0036F07534